MWWALGVGGCQDDNLSYQGEEWHVDKSIKCHIMETRSYKHLEGKEIRWKFWEQMLTFVNGSLESQKVSVI